MSKLNEKARWIAKLVEYYDSWDEEDYGYVDLTLDGKLIRTNNLDCDGGRYFNKKTFAKYINNLIDEWISDED